MSEINNLHDEEVIFVGKSEKQFIFLFDDETSNGV